MKQSIIAVLILILFSAPALGRLGEDETTASFRYGDPIKEEKMNNDTRKLYYHDKPYDMEITYKKDRAVIIIYQLDGEAKRMSLWRIEHILHNNARKEGGWKSIWYLSNELGPRGQIHFINEQQNATATYDLVNNKLTVRYAEE